MMLIGARTRKYGRMMKLRVSFHPGAITCVCVCVHVCVQESLLFCILCLREVDGMAIMCVMWGSQWRGHVIGWKRFAQLLVG